MTPLRSMAERLGAAALVAAGVSAVVHPPLAALPLAAFVGACTAAPFFPRIGFFLPVVSRGPRNRPQVAITFDDGPDPATTPALLDLLDFLGVKAAFFLVGSRVDAHPLLARQLMDRGHEIGCHSYGHDLLLGLRRPAAVRKDLNRAASALSRIGVRPLAYRPPVGIVTPRIAAAVHSAGMIAVTFSRRGWDAGNRRISGLSERILRRVRAGDVILMHDVMPKRQQRRDLWLAEVEKTVAGIRDRGLSLVSLETLIGRPVMDVPSGSKQHGG